MSLKDYFENAKGVGVLATADADGKVNVAVYARPHFLDPEDDDSPTFIMNERLSYANVQTNPNAAYLFIEEGDGYIGKRLALTKTGEEHDQEKIKALRRRNLPDECYEGKTQHLVSFRADGVRPLIGTEE
jgi:predicted pyridoxine 5'-phosphate oxidase superfamily flavin-nucleotide-binding protein